MERSKMARVYTGYNYQLVPGDGDSGNHLFRVDKTSDGYSRLYTAAPIDYEAYATMLNPHVSIRLRVTDERGNFFEKKLTLNILDVQEVPEELKIDIVLIGGGGGGGAQDDGNGGPGGSGSQYSFTTTFQKGVTYGLHVGSGGLGGLNSAHAHYSTTGGQGGETPGFPLKFFGGNGGWAGPSGSSGGGGGGGAGTVFSRYDKGGWYALAVAAGGGGGTGRRERPAFAGKGGDNPDWVERTDIAFNGLGIPGNVYLGGEVSGGGRGMAWDDSDSGACGGGGGGAEGGYGGQHFGAYFGANGGRSGVAPDMDPVMGLMVAGMRMPGVRLDASGLLITRANFKPSDQSITPGREGGGATSTANLWTHGLAERTPLGSMAGKWWNGLLSPDVGSGGYSGINEASRPLFSNGKAGAAIVRYKDFFPEISFGGEHRLSGGYHIHVFEGSATYSLKME